ncbi:magnesium-translocating P-type ATPase [Planctomyces sp. SH-PL62]|uniref:magnesium-translocating P-type ATPase n=1 Tax=Planctomyces sp. SH-PL62 TaxID=1636152 RepID=UPI00078B3D8C|nr:magnesium-translocating P-type ATPase [Planctomyces sp. SH-PL62]AMV37723.1 Magnesium-transporting ATPase, P-type 1 [Planctomyces sp. SH-PL62]
MDSTTGGERPEADRPRSGEPLPPIETLLESLGTTPAGLAGVEASRRLAARPSRRREAGRGARALTLLIGQFKSPIILLLLVSAALSASLGDSTDTLIISAIVLASGLLGFRQEWVAADAVAGLLALIRIRATILRDGRPAEIPIEEVVPGDVALLNAGDLIPGDGRLLEARDLFVNEAALTGETFPVEKAAADGLFQGTDVVSGAARLLVVHTGEETEFGRISGSLRLRPPENEFEHGIRRFGYLLLELTLLLVLAIFAINVVLHRPALESFLFALAIAVGLTPQLLPAIISVNLAHGARRMARRRVIVRRLAAIESLGGMDVFCSDKTGTLTEGKVRLRATLDVEGAPSEPIGRLAYLNAALQSGYADPIDRAVVAAGGPELDGSEKLDEIPYDFVRKRLSVLVRRDGRTLMVTKGALDRVLEICTTAETASGEMVEMAAVRPGIDRLAAEYGGRGDRLLGLASRDLGPATGIERSDESGMTFRGLLVFDDPLRPEIAETLGRLAALGVATKVISGDNRLTAAHAARLAGLPTTELLTGGDLRRMSDEALIRRVGRVAVFAEVEPNQKERIILALKKAGHVVGYLGDGINDAPALHAADVGVSVADAVDVAREAAQIVLLEKDLRVLEAGVREGRRTFANTMKYVFMATSANFGNMSSMAAASLFLPFLPLLPKQVLLTNLLTDLPEMTIAGDRVDPEMVDRPRRWDLDFIRRFMFVFGAVSSAFDFLTFAVLIHLLGASPGQFRTGWFMESVVSASLIVLVVRTRRPAHRSRPARPLTLATALVAATAASIPYTPLAPLLGFEPLPARFLLALALIVGLYLASAEAVKAVFYRREAASAGRTKAR